MMVVANCPPSRRLRQNVLNALRNRQETLKIISFVACAMEDK